MSENFKVKEYNESIPDYFAVREFRGGILDLGITMTGSQTPNGLGLAHEVVGAAEHLLIFGVPAAPLALPDEYGGSAANMKNQERTHREFDTQQRLTPVLRTLTINGLPGRVLRLGEVNGSTRHHAHVHDLFAVLYAALPLTKDDLGTCKSRIAKPYQREILIRPFVADQLLYLGYMTAGGQGLSNSDAVELLKSAFLSTRVDQADFAPAVSEFLREHGGLAGETPNNWCAFIIIFVEERLKHHANVNVAARKAVAHSAAEDKSSVSVEEDAETAREFALFLAEKSTGKTWGKPTGTPTAPTWAAPTGAAQPSDPLYCWSHGACGHTSKGCKKKKAGHKEAATYRNQLGGKRAY